MFIPSILRPISERRKILQNTIKEIPGRIMLSEQQLITVRLVLG
jgi:hypothetical protein